MTTPVAVTGIGMVTPVGVGTAATWHGLLRGRSAARTHPVLAGLPVDFCCAVDGLDAPARLTPRLALRLDRFSQMALLAAREAMADAGLPPGGYDPQRTGVVLGTGATSMERYDTEIGKLLNGRHRAVSPLIIPRSIPNICAGEVSFDITAHGPSLTVSTACASGATAIGIAMTLLAAGQCDTVLAGGAESVCNRISSVGFSQLGALSTRTDAPAEASRPFDRDRDGFVLAEGAAVLVLERATTARERGARAYALLTGYSAGCDAHHVTAPSADGIERAVRGALRSAGLRPRDIDHINAHGTSTPLNDRTEAGVLHRLFPHHPPVTSFKGATGHAIGAAGAIEAAGTALTLHHQVIPPTANHHRTDPAIVADVVAGAPRRARLRTAISTSFGFGGQNAVLVLTTA
ncbi:beta-ketoacyl-[acyl-carrier-protein] synthase family protein [Streptomyces caatingaensis]|uniref:3-oxoacyl-ACP synthase n=1 Tax=Streptomyces caatingaensis TaxID=1678637 RepID=A0A0K9XKN4_9ACTN|nr:beta-ketoacyl-[acyl-carrier-protein] synthase family protein [Streptomyces caatingaensis]KNB53863.1 3-oxoacyl-ACP synthase [Streptomyces caatingaensis]